MTGMSAINTTEPARRSSTAAIHLRALLRSGKLFPVAPPKFDHSRQEWRLTSAISVPSLCLQDLTVILVSPHLICPDQPPVKARPTHLHVARRNKDGEDQHLLAKPTQTCSSLHGSMPMWRLSSSVAIQGLSLKAGVQLDHCTSVEQKLSAGREVANIPS